MFRVNHMNTKKKKRSNDCILPGKSERARRVAPGAVLVLLKESQINPAKVDTERHHDKIVKARQLDQTND